MGLTTGGDERDAAGDGKRTKKDWKRRRWQWFYDWDPHIHTEQCTHVCYVWVEEDVRLYASVSVPLSVSQGELFVFERRLVFMDQHLLTLCAPDADATTTTSEAMWIIIRTIS